VEQKMKKIIGASFVVLCLVALSIAGDLGYVSSVQRITDNDGNSYIKVGYSSNVINVPVQWVPQTIPSWYSGEFYIQSGTDDTWNNVQYATMIKCLSTHSLTIDLANATYSTTVTGSGVYVTSNNKINNPNP
jgi:hypothetical protein